MKVCWTVEIRVFTWQLHSVVQPTGGPPDELRTSLLHCPVRPSISPDARLTLQGLEYPEEPGRPGSCGGRSSRSS